jgi:AraC family transcriptional regulator of adaptative response / DNA-3-methyladenine glycosylase II
VFVPCAAAAQEAGFRPCLRCRPEASPGTPAWLGTCATVSRALRLISEGALDRDSVASLAERLGIGERHLRRLFLDHLGAPPLAVAQTRRLLFAKKLIDETPLPMAQIAFAAGFSSIRRFNDSLRGSYRRTPTQLRRNKRGAASQASDLTLRLPYRPPLDWAALTRFLAPRATPGVEVATPAAYRRTLCLDGIQGVVEVRPAPGADHLLAKIRLAAPVPLIDIAERLRRIFDLGADPAVIAAQLGRDPRLARRLRGLPGVRVPGTWDGFELAVRAVLGQQVSVAGATRLARRLVEAYGEPLQLAGGADSELDFVFPTPAALAEADPGRLGLPRVRAAAIAALARAIAKGELRLDASLGLDEAIQQLSDLPGIGEWTAHYIAMRACREPDAFPAADLGLRRALGSPGDPAPAARVREAAEAWRPWRAYAALLLWSGPEAARSTPAGTGGSPRR